MTLIVENGTGVAGAETYVSVEFIDGYWGQLAHMSLAAIWLAEGDIAKKEGAAREAAQFLDRRWGAFYLGKRRGRVQGLLFPRIEAYDCDGIDIPELPAELQAANCELAVRALNGPLSEDLERGGEIISEADALGPMRESVTYSETNFRERRFGEVEGLLEPILNGMQPNSRAGNWNWA